MNLEAWQPIDDKAVAISRALAMDAVQKVGNGHPGTAMSLAPVAYTLFQRILKHDPANPNWIARDRFILSCGHSSLTLYIQLFLSGYGVELEDLKQFRTFNSLTPGHPEYGHTVGVETTTGPLGQGVANAVGMAMAARYEKGLLDPENDQSIFDHNIWVIASDGDLQEGISIEGDTHVAFTEDVSARYKSYGWEVLEVNALTNGDVDRQNLELAMIKAVEQKTKPVLIRLKTVIAWPAPKAQGTSKSHGSALGEEEVAATKSALGLDPSQSFYAPSEVITHARKIKERGSNAFKAWEKNFKIWQDKNPEKAKLLDRLLTKKLPEKWEDDLPIFSSDKEIATRAASGKVIQAIAASLPEFWGGSADLAESNNTTIEGGGSFLPKESLMKNANPFGRIIHFGIREHAMGAILNGAALHGLVKPFAGTFLVFSDYMRGAVRLSALMQLPVTYVWTHDSIGLGEDGPTHQPVEHLAALRTIPGLDVIRPADANEVSACWVEIIKRGKPAGLALSRQNLPVIDRSKYESTSGSKYGAYVLSHPDNSDQNNCQVILIATGSEVYLALSAQEELLSKGIKAVKARVSIEAGIAQPWYRFLGDAGVAVSLEHFGASASAPLLFKEFGFTVENIVKAAKESIAKVNG